MCNKTDRELCTRRHVVGLTCFLLHQNEILSVKKQIIYMTSLMRVLFKGRYTTTEIFSSGNAKHAGESEGMTRVTLDPYCRGFLISDWGLSKVNKKYLIIL